MGKFKLFIILAFGLAVAATFNACSNEEIALEDGGSSGGPGSPTPTPPPTGDCPAQDYSSRGTTFIFSDCFDGAEKTTFNFETDDLYSRFYGGGVNADACARVAGVAGQCIDASGATMDDQFLKFTDNEDWYQDANVWRSTITFMWLPPGNYEFFFRENGPGTAMNYSFITVVCPTGKSYNNETKVCE